MKRQITLDTETTGFNPKSGDKIVEIGLVEIINGQKTGNNYHMVIDPQRDIPEEVVKVHGIDNEKVKGQPTFKDVADEVINFVRGAEVIIHNADFDLKFLNEELSRAGKGKFLSYIANCRCSLEWSRKLFPKKKKYKGETKEEEALRKMGYSLDEMCERMGVDTSARTLHGALLDADLLADMFLKLNELHPLDSLQEEIEQVNWERPQIVRFNDINNLLVASQIKDEDLENHQKVIDDFSKKSPMIYAKQQSVGLKM